MKIAVVGVGNLGGALARGLVAEGHLVAGLTQTRGLPTGVSGGTPAAVLGGADVVLVCVKPKDVAAVASSLSALCPAGLWVSCAAGVTLSSLQAAAPGARWARAMPTIGAAVGASVTGVVLGESARDDDAARLADVFGAVGSCRVLSSEEALHAVTAVGASGPAFLLRCVEALSAAGVGQGLSAADAQAFAVGAMSAAALRLLAPGAPGPQALRAEVTSPNGTTAAGLAILDVDVDGVFAAVVRAAVERSRQLSS